MNDRSDWTRRDFIRAAGAAGGALLMANAHGEGSPSSPRDWLHGVSDIHVHAAPDTKARAIDELSFAREAWQAGYRSIMFKSNDWSCHDRAFLIRQALPQFECFGSLCMNRVHGDRVNVYAAEQAIKTSGRYCRCIWMPTLDAAYPHAVEKRPGKGIPVLDDTGRVLPEVVRVMEICAEADIIFATGHSSSVESIVMAEKARNVGVGKFVVTHANSLIWKMTPDQIRKCIDLGAFIEYCYLPVLWGPGTGLPDFAPMSGAEFAAFAALAPESSFITTDLGQRNMPHPLEGMRACILELLNAGMSQRDMDRMLRANPAWLMGLTGEDVTGLSHSVTNPDLS